MKTGLRSRFMLVLFTSLVFATQAPSFAQSSGEEQPSSAEAPSPDTEEAQIAGIAKPSTGVAPAAVPIGGGTTVASPIPPEKFSINPGGVDMRTGTYKYSKTDLSLGQSGDAGLSLERTMQGTREYNQWLGTHFSHNWDIRLLEERVQVAEANTPGQYDYVMSASYGGLSKTFRSLYNGPYRQVSNDAFANLTFTGTKSATPTYTFTAIDGTVVVFRPLISVAAGGNECARGLSIARCVYASTVTKADGTKYTLEYDSSGGFARLRSVTSSRGFAMLFEYLPIANNYHLTSKACVINLSVTPKPANNVCPVGAQTVNYGYSGQFMTSATDVTGNTFSYAQPSANVVQMLKPGSATPYYSAGMIIGDDRLTTTSQQFFGGLTYSYAWDNYGAAPESAGGYYIDNLGNQTIVKYNGYLQPNTVDPTTIITPGPELVTDPLGRSTAYDYCLPQNGGCAVQPLQSATSPEGNKRFYTYDGSRNITQIRQVAKAGSGLTDIIISANYTGGKFGQPGSTTDAKGNVSDFTYDTTHGGVLTETMPAATVGGVRPQKRYTYGQFYAWYKNASGVLVQAAAPVWLVTQISECRTTASCIGTADETRTTFSYGAAGTANNLLPTSQTIAAGDNSVSATTSWTYDVNGNRLTEDGPLSGTADITRWRYDAMRRVVGEIAPDPDGAAALKHRAARNTYDTAGRLTKVERGTVNSQSDTDWAAFAALESIETDYDLMDRKLQERKKSGSTTYALTQYSYDALGRLECTAVRMNPAVYGSLPASACTLGTEGSEGPDRITKLTYNAASELIKTTVAYGTPHQADDETNSYTLNGKLATVTDGENNRTTFEYDGHDRLGKTRYPVTTLGALASSTTDYEQATYDANGNVTQRRLRDGQLINTTYDNLNRATAKDVPNIAYGERDVTYTYDLLSRLISASNSDGLYTWFGYDALGRMTSDNNYFGGKSLEYDQAGRMIKLTWPDGIHINYDYDVTGAVTAIRENGATSGIGVLAVYGYDNLGRRTALTRGNGTVTSYSYDPVSRLASFTQDLTGSVHDLTVGSFTYNPASQITGYSRSNDSYAWTGHYNVTRSYGTNGLNQLTTAGATALGYDGRGNLTQSGSSIYGYTSENRLATAPSASLYYDPTGRLMFSTAGQRFDHWGSRLTTERDGSTNAIVRRYVHGPNDDEPVVWYEGAGTNDKRWLHTDERGSVVALTNSTGSAFAINAYDEYGIPASTNIGRFQYTGQAWLPEVGLYYYKARMYSPTLGRFMQTDPIGYEDGINWYDYVANDPVNQSDPNGMLSCPEGSGPTDCVDDATAPQPGPDEETQEIDEIVVTARRERKFTSGERIRFPSSGELEQGFRINEKGIFPVPFLRSGVQRCSDNSSRRANAINLSGLGGDNGGHTHGGGDLTPLPGPEDGRMAAATGRTAYQMSSRGAFAIERTASGFRVRRLSGAGLSGSEQDEMRGLIKNWNQNNGGSGVTCTFTPD